MDIFSLSLLLDMFYCHECRPDRVTIILLTQDNKISFNDFLVGINLLIKWVKVKLSP
jgi:hypothetical protein